MCSLVYDCSLFDCSNRGGILAIQTLEQILHNKSRGDFSALLREMVQFRV